MTTAVLQDAAADIESGRRFYDSQRPGAGDCFVESLLSDLDSLRPHAGVYQRHFGFFRCLSKRFPFAIDYGIESETACVYAILDYAS